MQTPIEYEQSTGLVREVYDDIRATRKTDDINNFWKVIAHHPPTLQRTWTMLKEVMGGPGRVQRLHDEVLWKEWLVRWPGRTQRQHDPILCQGWFFRWPG